MNGLFRRLAERAIGQRSPVLHATVLPSYALTGDGLSEVDPLPLSPAVTMTPSASESADSPAEPYVAAPTAQLQPREHRYAARPSPAPHQRDTASQPKTAAPSTAIHDPTREVPTRPTPRPAEPAMAAVIRSLPSTEIERPAPVSTQEVPRPPAPLLARPALRNDQPTPVAAFNPPPTPPVADEIHVHIGRIEVTALHEAPSTKQPVRKPQPSLSLDDYLAKRRGEKT